MSINFPLTPPSSPGFQSLVMKGPSLSAINESQFTFSQQVYQYTGERWEFDAQLPPMTLAQAGPWIAFLLALRGVYGTFNIGDRSARKPKGTVAGNAAVNGAGQTGTTLAIKGRTPGETILRGDYLQIVGGSVQRLHMNLSDAVIDGSGHATLDIFPRLREIPSDNAVITFVNAVGQFRLKDNQQSSSWSLDKAKLAGIQFSGVEAI